MYPTTITAWVIEPALLLNGTIPEPAYLKSLLASIATATGPLLTAAFKSLQFLAHSYPETDLSASVLYSAPL